MAKDPAFLFYTSDFLTGTSFMTDDQVGKYIRLLCLQHQTGHLSYEDMLKICKTHDKHIFGKFVQDSESLFYNERLELESVKRKKYSESRSKNRSSKKDEKPTYDPHMENENIDTNTNSSSTQYSKNMIHGKNYVESHTMMERAIKAFRDNGLIATKENVKLICKRYITEIDAKMEDKQTLKLFAEHFISWAKMHGKKYQPQSKSRIGL